MVALISTVLILVFILVTPYSLNAQRDIKDLEREYYELDYKVRQWDKIRQQSGKVVIPENFQQDLARWNQLSAQLAVARAKKAANISAEENTKNALVELIKHEKTTEYALSAIDGMLQHLKAEEEFYRNWEREASLDTGIASTLYGQDRERFQRLKDEAVRRQRELRQQIESLELKQNYLNNFKSSVKAILSAKEIRSAVEEGDFFSAAEKAIDMGSDIAEKVYDKKTFEEVSGRLEVAKGFLDVGNKIHQGNYLDASITAANTVDKLLDDYKKEYDKENKTLQLFMESDFVDKSLKDKALKVIDISNERKSKIEHLVNFKNKVKYVNERLGKFKKYYGYYKMLTGEIAEYERIASMPGRSETTTRLIYGMSKLGDAFNVIADAMPPMLKETIGQFLNFYADALKLGETIDSIVREWFEKREACLNIYGQNIHNSYALKIIEERWGRDDLCIRPAVEFKQSGLAMYFDDNLGKTHHPIRYFFMPNLSSEPIGLTQEQYSKVVKISSDYSAYASFVESSYRLTNEDLSDIITAVLSDRDSFTINDGYFRDTTFKISQLSRDVEALFHIKASIGEELTVSNHRNMIYYWYKFVDSTESTERLCSFKLYDNNNIMHRMFVSFLKNREIFDDFVVRQRLTNPNSNCKIEVSLSGDKETIVNKPATVLASIKNARDTFRYEWLNDFDKSLLSSKESVRVMAGQEGRYPLRFNLYVKSGSREIRLFSLPYVVTVKPDPDMKECVYQYSQWGECNSTTRTQRRTVISKSPAKCVEKTPPVLEQTCIPTVKEPVPCTYQYSEWSACDSNTKRQTRTVLSKSPAGCIEKTPPMLEQSCTPVVKDAPTCFYEYSDWGECVRATKKQTRTVIAKKPDGCVERQKPSLERGCTPPPTEEEKRHQYFNCLCRCSSGWAGHIGVWYDPEEKTKPECKSSGPCIGGIGAFGCSRRHFFAPPNDCAKGCWESAFGKGTYDPDKADKMRREENKKYAKPLTVKLKASKNPADFGDVIDIQAQASDGTGGYKYNWSGCAQEAKDNYAKVTFKDYCKSCTVSVTVIDQDGNSASDSLLIQCNSMKVKLSLDFPKEKTLPIGSKANLIAEVLSGDKPASGTFYYQWQPHPEVVFGDPKNLVPETTGGAQSRNTALFKRTGNFKIWVDVFKEIEGRKVKVGESEQIPINVVNPKLNLKVSKTDPLVGDKVVVTVQEEPKMSDEFVSFWWEYSGNIDNPGVEPNISNSRAYSFKPKDTKPVTITIHAKAKDGGEDLGEAKTTITAKSYQVSISQPRYLGPKPRIWKCDTQLGGACPGLVEVADTQFAVFRDIFMKATVTPTPESPRYRWSIDPSGSCGFPGAGDEIKINCSQTGIYTVKVEVTNADGVKLGEATQTVTVSISDEMLKQADNSKQAYDKVQQAKQLVGQGKLDEGINFAQEAVILDSKNQEAKSLSDKWKKERDSINKNIEDANKHINEKKFADAEKELNQAKALHPKYAKVIEAEKRLNEEKNKYRREVTNKINDAKRLLSEKKIDEAVSLIKEVAKIDKTTVQPVINQISQEAKKIGWDALHHGDYKLAIKRLEQAVELNPLDIDAQKKLKEAKDYEAKMPQIEAKIKEFDQLIAEKKVVSSYQKLLEIQDILRSIGASGQSSTNPVIIKYNKDYNELNKWYNELTQKTNTELTKLFQQKDWISAEKLLTEVLKYEHTEANRKNYESSLQMVRGFLAEERNKKQRADQLWDECIAFTKQNRHAEALSKCKESLNISPDEKRRQALAQLEQEVAKKQKADELWNKCINLAKANRLNEAVSMCEQSLNYWSNDERIKALNSLKAETQKSTEQAQRKAQADRLWEECIALAKANRLDEAMNKCEQSLSYWSSEDRQRAYNQLKSTLQKTKEENQKRQIADRLWSECIELARQKNYEQAWQKCDESLKYWRNDQRIEATAKLKEEMRNTNTSIKKPELPIDISSTSSPFYHIDLTPYGGKKGTPRKVKSIEVDDNSWIRLKATDERRLSLDISLPEPVSANAIAIVSNLDNAHYVKDDVTTTVMTVYTKSGSHRFEIKAGVHSSEWNRSETHGADHRFPKENYIGNKRWLAIFNLPHGSVVTGIRFDHRDTDKKYYHMGSAPGFCLRGITLIRSNTPSLPTDSGSFSSPEINKGIVIFNNGNIDGVYNNPTRATVFTINQPYVITLIQNYHWNKAKGSIPGTIALRDQGGRTYGPWQAKGSPGQGGVPNAYWTVYPNITLPAGTYTVIDSEPYTWAQNSGSGGAGHTRIEGYPAVETGNQQMGSNIQQGRTINAELTNNSRENVHIFVEGQDTFGPHNRLTPGGRRTVSIKAPTQAGFINFIAGRNGQVLAACRWEYVPDYQNRVPVIRFSDPNILSCSTGIR